jgi:hypothetical protein
MNKKLEDYIQFYIGCNARLDHDEYPDGIICKIEGYAQGKGVWIGVKNEIGATAYDWKPLRSIKPLLRPLKSMTEREILAFLRIEISKGEKSYEIKEPVMTDSYIHYHIRIPYVNRGMFLKESHSLTEFTPDEITWLLSKGFDLFKLLDYCMALDITTF